MNPPIFQIGQEVEIIACPEKRFRITWITEEADGTLSYSACGLPWYPASSLRLVEELKIGDFVEVIGQPKALCDEPLGKIARIELSGMNPGGDEMMGYQIERNGYWYPASSLRKLTPDEIAKYQAIQMPAKLDEIQELRRRIHDLEMNISGFTNGPEPEYVQGISYVRDPIRDRLSAIEKSLQDIVNRQGDQKYQMKREMKGRTFIIGREHVEDET